MFLFKKGVHPVVSVALLLVVSVLAVISLQTWYGSYQSNLFSDLNSQSSIDSFSVGVEDIIGEELYFNAGNNLSITRIEIDGTECSLGPGTYSGLSSVDISSCLDTSSSQVLTVRLFTEEKVISRSVFVKEEDTTTNQLNIVSAPLYFGIRSEYDLFSDTVIEGNIVYHTNENAFDREFYSLNLDTNTTTLVANINPGTGFSGSSNPLYFTKYGDNIYFRADDGTTGDELWRYNGTDVTIVDDFRTSGSGDSSPSSLFVYDGLLYLSLNDGSLGSELYSYDNVSFNLVSDIVPGVSSSSPYEFYEYNEELFFNSGVGSSSNRELAKYNGSIELFEINPSGSSNPRDFIEFNGELYFSADNGTTGRELYKYNTSSGFSLVADIYPGTNSSEVSDLTIFDNKLFFRTGSYGNNYYLYSYDGSSLTIEYTATSPNNIQYLTAIDSMLFFAFGTQAAYFDGNEFQVQDVIFSPTGTGIRAFYNYGDMIFFDETYSG